MPSSAQLFLWQDGEKTEEEIVYSNHSVNEEMPEDVRNFSIHPNANWKVMEW